MARPTDYNEEMLEKAKDYLADCTKYEDVVPTAAGLSLVLDVSRKTLYNWGEQHEEFLHILERLQSTQERELLVNGLQSIWNPVITKLMLGKHGYSEKHQVDATISPLDEEARQKANAAISGILPKGDAE